MSTLDFFRKNGLVLKSEFLAPPQCRVLCAHIRNAAPRPAEVYGGAVDVDLSARSAWQVSVTGALEDGLTNAIRGLRTELADHFAIPLAPCEDPSFLRYGAGGFHRPHKDRASAHADSSGDAQQRRVSISLLLNDEYAGGALTFYGLINDPAWRDYGFALPAETGLLVAFRSDMLHEVTPVLAGERCSLVTWFHEDQTREARQ